MNDITKSDERCVSWKVLLPVGPESKILAVGLANGAIAGLSRNYRKLDIKPVGNSQYDVIIIGDKANDDLCNLCDFISQLEPDGIIVNAGRKCFARQLNDMGFRYSRDYAALPARKPRLFIPLSSKKLRARGLAFHSPGSFKARIGLTVAKALSCLGVQSHLTKHTINLYARNEGAFEGMGLARRLSEQLGYQVIDIVVFAGSELPRRKITALAVAAGQNSDVVVKIADTDLGTQAIKQESKALRVIAASSLSGQAPKLIAEEQWYSYYVQLQEQAIGSNHKQIARLTESHLEFLSKLAMIDRKVLPLRETRTWRNVKALAGATSSKALPQPVCVALEKVLSDEFANVPVVCHWIHGDFAPWNIKVHNSKLFVYDWEYSEPKGLALEDIFCFFYRRGHNIGNCVTPSRLYKKVMQSFSCLNSGAKYTNFDFNANLFVVTFHELLTWPSALLEELVGFVHARLDK